MRAQIRSIARGLLLDFLGIGAKPSSGIHLLNSHVLTTDEELNSDFFDHQLKNLSKKSTIIPFGEAVELIKARKEVGSSLIAFSYDDGFLDCYSHIAPVLEKYNGYGCFFINPNFIESSKDYIDSFLRKNTYLPLYKRPMNWKQVTELQTRGHIIGAHTMDHNRISKITNENELISQIGNCKKGIENRLKGTCDYFAFPFGCPERDFDIRSVDVAEQFYKYIFSASNWKYYFSYNGRVINRRHCEPYWKANHIDYFLSKKMNF